MDEERGRIIVGLEDAKEIISTVAEGIDRDNYRCLSSAETNINDAIVFLKEQQPRLMALEELINKIGKPVYFESHGTYMGKDGFWILPALFTQSCLMRYVHPLSSHYSELGLYCYYKTWRCWTSRPTDEQREAVKWE
jgi:hypothetical protein